MRFVLDCSVTMAWCLPTQSNAYAEHIIDYLEAHEAIVPSLWELEVVNVLLHQIRRKHISTHDAMEFFATLRTFNISIFPIEKLQIFSKVFTLGLTAQLSSYDAAYLQLAISQGIPLATTDKALKAAAKKIGVLLVD